MTICCDATVVREPYNGVQRAVVQQVRALLDVLPPERLTILAQDSELLAHAAQMGSGVRPLPFCCRRVTMRVAWQQLILPGQLREGTSFLHALSYTAPLRCPVRYLLNVHDVIAFDHPEWCASLNAFHMRRLMPGSIRRATTVIVSAQSVADRVLKLFQIPVGRILVIPLGVDTERFAARAETAEATIRPARPYLLFVGNIEPKKGIPSLLDAYSRIADRLKLDLVLCGRGAWRSRGIVERIENCARSGHVHWLQHASDAAVADLYRHASCFVFPSLAEGFGLPVLEAMAAGVPVIHSDHPVLMETAGGAGAAFRRGDGAALAEALIELHESPLKQQELAERGRLRARELTWRRWGERVKDAYATISA